MDTTLELILEIPLHELRLKIALERLSKKKLYLEKIESDPKSSQSYLNSVAGEINDFEKVIESYEIIKKLERNRNDEIGREKYLKGRKDEKEANLGGVPHKHLEQEAYRAYHELLTKQKWADHY
ncbi:MAG: hypothetical protein K8R85_05340 [Bacteroidetes bacterium]|nr:hypothetical protein [Bacteroidota bacterium]